MGVEVEEEVDGMSVFGAVVLICETSYFEQILEKSIQWTLNIKSVAPWLKNHGI